MEHLEPWQYQAALGLVGLVGTLLGVLWRMQVAVTVKDAAVADKALLALAAAQDKDMHRASTLWEQERGRIWSAVEEDRLDRARMKEVTQSLALAIKDCTTREWHTLQMARMEDSFNRQTADIKQAMSTQFDKLEKAVHEVSNRRKQDPT